MDHLQQHGLTRCQAKALEIERWRARLQLETGGHRLSGRLRSCRQNARLSDEAQARHLLGEAVGVGEVAIDAWLKDVRATALGPLQPLLAGELIQSPANGDQAAAVVT